MWMAWPGRRLPRSESRWIFRPPEETSIGAVPLQAANRSRVAEPGRVAGLAEDGGGDDRAGPEDAGHGGARCLHRGGELGPGVADLGVQAAQAGGELAAGPGGRARTA